MILPSTHIFCSLHDQRHPLLDGIDQRCRHLTNGFITDMFLWADNGERRRERASVVLAHNKKPLSIPKWLRLPPRKSLSPPCNHHAHRRAKPATWGAEVRRGRGVSGNFIESSLSAGRLIIMLLTLPQTSKATLRAYDHCFAPFSKQNLIAPL